MNGVKYKNETVFPTKIVCVGRNYVEHIKELGNEKPDHMVLFNKPNSAISEELYFVSEDNHYEAEISFLVKNGAIVAVGFGFDITKRELQTKLKNKGLPWERAKAFDKSAVFSEFVEIETVDALELELRVDGALRQKGTVELMIYKPEEIVKEIESFMSLDEYDIVMSGTPKGVGGYKKGEKFQGILKQKSKTLISKSWIVK